MSEVQTAQAESPDANTPVVTDVPAQDAEQKPAEGEAAQKPQEDNTPFPKKAVNAITRRDRQIGRLRGQISDYDRRFNEMQAQIAELGASRNAPKEPVMEDFETVGDWVKAVAKFEAQQGAKPKQDQENLSPEKIKEQAFQEWQQQQHFQQREAHAAEQAAKTATEFADFKQVVDENIDILDSSPLLDRLILEADNAPLVLYTLAKEGKLEQVAQLPPQQMLMEIARAQSRGEAMARTQKVSKAPAPISGVKGTAAGQKSVTEMSPDELLKWAKS